jgi:Flp pilus assembly CpaF family ATPase
MVKNYAKIFVFNRPVAATTAFFLHHAAARRLTDRILAHIERRL